MRYATVIGLVIFLASGALPVAAQKAAPAQAPRESAPTTATLLNTAVEALNRQEYEQALAAVAHLDAASLSPLERSRAEQIRFTVAFAMRRFDDARAHLAAAIAAGGLTPKEVEQARYQVAQTFLEEQRWSEGTTALEQWFASVQSPDAAAYYLLAVAYWQMGDYDRAIAPAERAATLTDSPREPWVQLLLAVRLQRKDYQDAARLLQRLVVMAPAKKTYWMQLSSVYGQLGDYPSALATLQTAYDAGLLTDEADIRRFDQLRAYVKVP
jgi:tetratricopeptide (TPR) repeat protein